MMEEITKRTIVSAALEKVARAVDPFYDRGSTFPLFFL